MASSLFERRVEDQVDGSRHAPPLHQLVVELSPTSASQRVVAGTSVVLGDFPLRLDKALTFESVQGRIERALSELQDALGPLLDAFGNPPSVHRFELQRLEHQHIERALQQIASFSRHRSPFDRRKKSRRCSLRLSRGTKRPGFWRHAWMRVARDREWRTEHRFEQFSTLTSRSHLTQLPQFRMLRS